MPQVLILFGTTDGQTAKIVARLARALEGLGDEVDVVNAALGGKAVSPAPYAGVIVAASVHAGGYQRAVGRWVRRHAAELPGRPSALLSVCLGVLQGEPAVQRDLATIIERFLSRTGWRPSQVETVAGALRYTRYGFLKRYLMRRIARKAGGGTDTTRDYEYTDWEALKSFAGAFHRSLGGNGETGARPSRLPATGITT
jgi:menaquinone-dependent protoporphyrinogen oxidase